MLSYAHFDINRACDHTLLHRLKQHSIHSSDHLNATVLNEASHTLKNEEKRVPNTVTQKYQKIAKETKNFLNIS